MAQWCPRSAAGRVGTVLEAVEPRLLLSAATGAVFTAAPTYAVAGTDLGLTVTLEGANGRVDPTASERVTVSVKSAPTGATLPAAVTVAAVNGVATVTGLALTRVGTYQLQATAAGLATGTSAAFTVGGAAPAVATLVPLANPAYAACHAGQEIPTTETVQVTDAYGNPAGGTVTASAAGTTIGGSTTATLYGGKAEFVALTLPTVGQYTLTFADGAAVTTKTIDVLPPMLPANTFAAGTPIGPMTVDAAASFANWHAGPHAPGKVTFTVDDLDAPNGASGAEGGTGYRGGRGGSRLPLHAATGNAKIVKGRAVFRIPAMKKAGDYYVEVTDGHGDADFARFTVVGGAPARLTVGTNVSYGGIASALTVTPVAAVYDRWGNVASGAAGTVVTLSVIGPKYYGLLPTLKGAVNGILTATVGTNGEATFTTTPAQSLGSFRLRAVDGTLPPALSEWFYYP